MRAWPGDHFLGFRLDGFVKLRGNLAQGLGNLGGAKEVVLQPGNLILLFHEAADVVHGPVAVDQIQLGQGSHHHFVEGAIPRELTDDAQADRL
jgi:hypothetical protein